MGANSATTCRIDEAMCEVAEELRRATVKFRPFQSPHEGYAIILEELDEAWDEIKGNNLVLAREEMVQVAAMAARFLVDFPNPQRKE